MAATSQKACAGVKPLKGGSTPSASANALRRNLPRRAVGCCIDVDPLFEPQQLATQIKTSVRGKFKRPVAAEVLDLDVGPGSQEGDSNICMTAECCAHQRCAAAVVTRIDT